MRTIFILLLIHSFCFCSGQNIEIELPRTDADSLSYSLNKIEFDTINNVFLISTQTHDRKMGYIILAEYTGSLNEIDSIHVSSDRQNRICGLEFHSCEKSFQRRSISLSTYIIDEPKLWGTILVRTWTYESQYAALVEIAKTLNSYLPKKKKCQVETIRATTSWGSGMSTDDGIGYVFLNGQCAKSKIAEQSLRKYLKSCFTDEELKIIDLISIAFEINEANKVVVEHIFYKGPKKKLDKSFEARIKTCFENMEGWTRKKREWDGYKMEYVLSMRSPNVDRVAQARFEEIKALSVGRQKELDEKRNTYNNKYTKQQQDSIFEESIYQSMTIDHSANDEPYKVVEQRPVRKDEKFLDKINKQFSDLHPGKKFEVTARLTIGKNGEIQDVRYLKGLNPNTYSMFASLKKILMATSNPYTPGKQRGKPVSVYVVEQFKCN